MCGTRLDWLHVVKWMHWYWIGTAFKDWFIPNWQTIMHGMKMNVLYFLSNIALNPDFISMFCFVVCQAMCCEGRVQLNQKREQIIG
jgi:hypothetical protein